MKTRGTSNKAWFLVVTIANRSLSGGFHDIHIGCELVIVNHERLKDQQFCSYIVSAFVMVHVCIMYSTLCLGYVYQWVVKPIGWQTSIKYLILY